MKTNLESMLRSHPSADETRTGDYAAAAEALAVCIAACTVCADACLSETQHLAMLRHCISTDLDCADICTATLRLVLRQTESPNEMVHAQLHACVVACQQCADECDRHATKHVHCKQCAESCRRCQERCNFLLGEITSSGTAGEALGEEQSR